MIPENLHNIYFLGIGGIGMSALARYFHSAGKFVAGYDLTPSPLTHELQENGIEIHYEASLHNIPKKILDKNNTLIIRTPAVPTDNEELIYFQQNYFEIKKRAEVLGMIFNGKKGIAIAGTHGKTSVTSMTAFIMSQAPQGATAFLGGILKNINSNFILNESSPYVVAEADEYDRSFLHLYPDIALVTWIDTDHLDVYSSEDEIRLSFMKFIEQVKSGGVVILKNTIKIFFKEDNRTIYTYAAEDTSADFHARNIHLVNGLYNFDIVTPSGTIKDIRLRYPGITNVENAVAAAAATWAAGVNGEIIGKALSGFIGVSRRFDIQFMDEKCVYIDDYAHHPRELDAIISSVRKLFPERNITGIFQPHLFSRTKDFAGEFAQSLSHLDELIMLDIYPAREEPIPGITSKVIFDKVTLEKKLLCRDEDIPEVLKKRPLDILITMGAGNIDRMVEPIKQMLASR